MTTAPVQPRAERQAHSAPPRVPRGRDVLREQLRATGLELRAPMLIAAVLGIAATIFLALQIGRGDWVAKPHSEPSSLPAPIGALLAIAVWAREQRFGPGFLWTLPVDRTRHALIKVFAGWAWLMAGVVLFALCQLVLALVSGGRVLPVETLHMLAAPATPRGPIDPAALVTVRWAPGVVVWTVPFVSATTAYLLVSAFMLGIRRPLRWIAAAVIAVPVATVAFRLVGTLAGLEGLKDAPARAVSLLVSGPYGIEALLTMRTWSLDNRALLTTGERIHVWFALPNLAEWRVAALLWIGAGLLAVLAAASRHRERRRG